MDYLTEKGATSYMVKVNLDWYEDKTYWRRGYLSENFDKGCLLYTSPPQLIPLIHIILIS